MKTFFVEAKINFKVELSEKVIKQLKEELGSIKEVGLFTTIQFLDSLEGLNEQLEDNGIKVKVFKGKHSTYEGQILGCGTYEYNTKAFLYIGDGYFHPHALAMKNINKPIFIYNPFTKEFKQMDVDIIKKTLQKQKAAVSSFHMKDNIGILCSTKPGQNNLKKALKLKKELEQKGKKVYVFIENTIDYNQLENFPFIDVWVNTACPRIMYDDYKKFNKPIVNISEISDYEF